MQENMDQEKLRIWTLFTRLDFLLLLLLHYCFINSMCWVNVFQSFMSPLKIFQYCRSFFSSLMFGILAEAINMITSQTFYLNFFDTISNFFGSILNFDPNFFFNTNFDFFLGNKLIFFCTKLIFSVTKLKVLGNKLNFFDTKLKLFDTKLIFLALN